MRYAFLACIFLSSFIAAAGAGEPAAPAPDKRVALVIGNNAYTKLHDLTNPTADAASLARILAERGFEVISCDGKRPGCFDLSRDGLTAAIAQLAQKSQGASLAFVFYAGHGMGAPEGNVIAPIDARVDCERHQVERGVLVDEVLEALEGAKQKIIVLDACRDNPLGEVCPPATKAKLTFRDFKIPDAGNFLLVSSTKPGQVADDGLPGAHSPFALALLAALSQAPSTHFDQVFNRVAKTVIEKTSKEGFTQIPEMLIRGGAPEACLAGAGCAADPQAAALREELAALQRDRARDQELGETAKDYLALKEKSRGKPFSEDERRRELAALKEATRSLAARNDYRGEQALEKLKTGDTAAAERLFQEDLDAEEAEEKAEAQRRTERRKKAAASARNIAALSRWSDVAKALIYYKKAVDLDPDDAQTWQDFAFAAQDAGRTDESKAAFEQAALKASGEGADEIRFWAANGRGDIARAQGSLPEALRVYGGAREAMDRLAKADPGNAGWQRDLSVSYNRVGDVLVAQGNLPEALKSYQGSLAIADRLAKADPNNAGWQADLAASHGKLGQLYVRIGNKAEARQMFERGRAIVAPFAEKSGHRVWIGYLKSFDADIAALETSPYEEAQAAIQAAFEAKDFGKAAALRAKLAAEIEKAEREKAGKPGPETASELLALSWYRLFARDFKGALAASDRAIAIEPENIVLATNRAHALMFLGRAKEARALYLRYKGKDLGKGFGLWEAAVLNDFKEFEKRGLKHRQMAEIEALLAAK
ncbi:MAG: caspase family protein [Rhodomicrobium sp.]